MVHNKWYFKSSTRHGPARPHWCHRSVQAVLSIALGEILCLTLPIIPIVVMAQCVWTHNSLYIPGYGLHSHRPIHVTILTAIHSHQHMKWARNHQHWIINNWKKVTWSEESCFLLHHVDGWACVQRLPKNTFSPRYTVGCGQVEGMCWSEQYFLGEHLESSSL